MIYPYRITMPIWNWKRMHVLLIISQSDCHTYKKIPWFTWTKTENQTLVPCKNRGWWMLRPFFSLKAPSHTFLPDASGRKTSESFVRKDGDGGIERKIEARSNERSSNEIMNQTNRASSKWFKLGQWHRNEKKSKQKQHVKHRKKIEKEHTKNKYNLWLTLNKKSPHIFAIGSLFSESLISLILLRLDLFNMSCVHWELLILLHGTQRDFTGGKRALNSNHRILIRTLHAALLTFKPRPLTVTRHCLTTYVPVGFIADPSDLH